MLLSIGLLWIFAITVLVYQSVFFSVSKSNISSYVRNNKYLVLQQKMYFFFFCCHEILVHLFFFLSLSRLLTVAIFFVLIMLINDVYILDLDKNHTPLPLQLLTSSRGTQRQFLENICSEDDLRSRIFGTFFVKFLACLPLLGFRTSKNWCNCPFLTDFYPNKLT